MRSGLRTLAQEYSQKLVSALQFLDARSREPGNRFYGVVDVSRAGMIGHSSGAGVALTAAALANDLDSARRLYSSGSLDLSAIAVPPVGVNATAAGWPTVRGTFGMSPAPVSVPNGALGNVKEPIFFLNGALDRTIALRDQRGLFDSFGAAPRTYAQLGHGTHCFVDPAPSEFPPSDCNLLDLNPGNMLSAPAQFWVRLRV